MRAETLKSINEKIRKDFPDAEYDLHEFKDDGEHFELIIKSSKFAGLNLLAQHKLVYQCLDEYIKSGELHALMLKTSS